MTTFREREQAFEAKFTRDEETRFRARALRNKLFARWAARELGLIGGEAEDYERSLVRFAVTHPNDGVLADKVHQELKDAGVRLTLPQIMDKLVTFSEEATIRVAGG